MMGGKKSINLMSLDVMCYCQSLTVLYGYCYANSTHTQTYLEQSTEAVVKLNISVLRIRAFLLYPLHIHRRKYMTEGLKSHDPVK
jgi:hypothetical protein